MKKLCKLIVALFLGLSLSACSGARTDQKEAAITFFNALHKTMSADSIEISGTVDLKAQVSGTADFTLYLNQKDSLQLGLLTDVTAAGFPMKDFFNFYIRDGRTYLDSMGTKSQSVVENIGLKPDGKIESWDPFLSLDDEQKEKLFKSVTVNQDTYKFAINTSDLSYYLDSMGTTTLSQADMEATIRDGCVTALKLDIEGSLNMDGQGQSFKASASMKADNINKDVTVPYPSDLDSWGQ